MVARVSSKMPRYCVHHSPMMATTYTVEARMINGQYSLSEPCVKPGYEVSMEQIGEGHRSERFYKERGKGVLLIQLTSPKNPMVEVVTTSYRMDPHDLISAYGGSLGLFVGFSLYSTFQTACDAALRKCNL